MKQLKHCIVLLLIFSLLQANPIQGEANQPSYGGTLVWGTFNAPVGINPILTTHTISASLIPLLFNNLVRINPEGNIEPALAKSWEISKDQLTYTFYLHDNVFFHDGHQLTAEDVKFTYDTIINPEVGCLYRSHFKNVERFEVVDDFTFRIVLSQPFSPLIYKLVRHIIPKHLLKDQDLRKSSFNHSPIGSGPFTFKEWNKKTNQITLVANKNYFEGRPYLDRIITKSYIDNEDLWTAFMRGEVDFVNFITRQNYDAIKNNKAFKSYQVNHSEYYAISYNTKDSILRNKDIRKAIAYGINKSELFQSGSYVGINAAGPFHPDTDGFNHNIYLINYNPYIAKTILMHNGWLDKESNDHGEHHIRKKFGKNLELRILIDESNDDHKLIAKLIRQNLSEIGFKVTVILYTNEEELTPDFLAQHQTNARLRMFVGAGYDKSDNYDSSSNWTSLNNQMKLWPYENKEIDQLFINGHSSTNSEEITKTYQRIHEIVYHDHPVYFLYFPAMFHSVSINFQNTDSYFTKYMPDYVIKNWYIR
jgi:peptide/nickel transport system substrate-binding protein